ncbi:glycosyltransferase family 4 protein, partial [Staphylococcus aureus]|nr:glycosyltransferase family 4 protein [Staphylococcus aureus]
MTIGMEHMNLQAHPEHYQQDILDACRKLDLITTLTKQDQLNYAQHINTPVYTVPNIIRPVKNDTNKENII